MLLTLLLLWFIFSSSAQPASVSAYRSNSVTRQLNDVAGFYGELLSDKLVRKAAHFAEYTALGGCFAATFAAFFLTFRLWPAVLLAGGFTAFCDEMIQLFTPGRSCQFSDMLLDTCGVAFGILSFYVVFQFFLALRRTFFS